MEKEQILALAEKCGVFPRLTPAGTDEVWSTKRNVESFFDAAIESYKAELLKEVGEPVAKVMYVDSLKENNLLDCDIPVGTFLYSSDQVAAAILKATKPLEEEIERLKRQSANRLIGLCKGGEDNDELRARIAELEAEVERLSAAHVKACQANADSQAELAKAEQRVAEACALQVATETRLRWLDAARRLRHHIR